MPLLDYRGSVTGAAVVTPWEFAGIRTRWGSGPIRQSKRLTKLPALLAFWALTIVGLAQAEPDNNTEPQTAPSPIQLHATVQNGEIVGFEQMRRVFITVGSRRLVFLLPLEYHANVSDPKKIVLFKSDLTCRFTLRILEAAETSGTNLVSAERCRAWATNRFDEASITEELTLSAGGGTGPAFDLICKQDRVTRNVRLGFVATSVGVLECELATSPEQFAAAKTMMRILLRSLQISDAHGLLTIRVYRGEN